MRSLMPLLLGASSLWMGCASYELTASRDSGGYYEGDTTGGSFTEGPSQDSGTSENEDDFLKLEPAATDAYVFVANTSRDTVTRISVPSLQVMTTEVGKIPSVVLTTSDYKRAVTLNEGSDTISIIDAESLHVQEVAIRENFNQMALSNDGKWVLCWYNADRESQGSSGGVQSFNEVSLVNLETATHIPMVVGFNPKGIKWTADGTRALVISNASLALLDLTTNPPGISTIELEADPLNAPEAEEVELSPDGKFAFVRQYGADDLVLVSLDELWIDHLSIGGNPTDMDLSPDGSRLSVVARDARQVLSFEPASPYNVPEVVDFPLESPYGAVTFAGNAPTAILYTNASLYARYATWDLGSGLITERPLVKPIQTLSVSPNGDAMLIFHTLADDPNTDSSNPFIGHWAMTQIDLNDFRSNPLLLPAEPTGYSVSDDGNYGFFIMENEKLLESLSFSTLLPTTLDLPSQPVYLGVLPGTDTAYASQEYSLGRISFYDAATESLDTITGFELNSGISY